MIRLGISVEGGTEEAFIKDVLYRHFLEFRVYAFPINLGGNINIYRVVPEIARLYDSFDVVTTFYDFYGFKRHNSIDGDDLETIILDRVREDFKQRQRGMDERRFVPYIQMHEFEGLLFSDVDCFDILPDVGQKHIEALRAVRRAFNTPEDINNSKETAPSKQIQRLGIRYDKVEHAPIIATMIDLSVIRGECPRFSNWVSWVEGLGAGC